MANRKKPQTSDSSFKNNLRSARMAALEILLAFSSSWAHPPVHGGNCIFPSDQLNLFFSPPLSLGGLWGTTGYSRL